MEFNPPYTIHSSSEGGVLSLIFNAGVIITIPKATKIIFASNHDKEKAKQDNIIIQ